MGPDDIHYQILKHLPDISLNALIDLFNDIWDDGVFPPGWREATIIPIPKPGKDHTNPTNYRPIALTSCICKTFERMVNNRLVWYLEHHGILTAYQSGFRKKRSTIDQIIRLESAVREAFINKDHLVAIFFDLEKAYDTTWKYGIMKDLHDAGLRGHMPTFISRAQFSLNNVHKRGLKHHHFILHLYLAFYPTDSFLSELGGLYLTRMSRKKVFHRGVSFL